MAATPSEVTNWLRRIEQARHLVLVVGLGISGVAAARFLLDAGFSVVAVERSARDPFNQNSKFAAEVKELERRGLRVAFGIEGAAVAQHLGGVALAVLSPGVALDSPLVRTLVERHIPRVSELELGVELTGWPCVVVTGSNGKSTTATLLYEILKAGGLSPKLCGNIGLPVVAELDAARWRAGETSLLNGKGYLVLEASSYQLELCTSLKPKVSLLLNLSENHLERHKTMDGYLAAKARAFMKQDASDFAVLNGDDARAQTLRARLTGKMLWFAADNRTADGWFEYDPTFGKDRLYLKDGSLEGIDLTQCKLRGMHNRYNLAAAALAAQALGISEATIAAVLTSFSPLEHRLEPAGTKGGVLYINDSKSTTVASSVAAISSVLESEPNKSAVILLGGQKKAGSWEPVVDLLRQHQPRLRSVICFGKDGEPIAGYCEQGGVSPTVSKGLREAVLLARERALAGDLVLLSPGCASFDEFSGFEERGNVFKSLVAALT